MSFPSPVPTYHSDTYAAINPTNPELSTKGKNIVISGGGTGIGASIAESFAKSGASTISILGRRAEVLIQTKTRLETEYPKTKFFYYIADIVDKDALVTAFTVIKETSGPVDVLVANAGYLPDILPLAKSNLEEWYNGFEINVKGNFNLITAFIPVAAPKAAVIHISTGVAHLNAVPGYSSYHASKLASTKLFDYLHQEYPEFVVISVHPGVFGTEMGLKSEASGAAWPHDEIALPGTFVVWAASDEAKFLNGKFVWAHWDVEELKAMKDKIEGTDKFTLGLLGWP